VNFTNKNILGYCHVGLYIISNTMDFVTVVAWSWIRLPCTVNIIVINMLFIQYHGIYQSTIVLTSDIITNHGVILDYKDLNVLLS